MKTGFKSYLILLLTLIISCSKNDTQPNSKTQPTTPVTIKDAVFAFSQDFNAYALDLNSGAKIWSYTFPTQSKSFTYYGSLVASNGLMYVSTTEDPKLIAIDANTGEKKWDFAFSESTYTYPAISSDNSTVFIGGDQNKVCALDAYTGKQKWMSSVGNFGLGLNIKEQDGTVYYSSNYYDLYAIDAKTGAIKWSQVLPAASRIDGFSVASKTIYIHVGDGCTALDASTGAIKYKFLPAGAEDYTLKPNPITGDGVFYCILYFKTDNSFSLYSVDSATGQKVWEFKLPYQPAYGTPYLKDNILYVNGTFGKMLAIDAKTGNQIWLNEKSEVYGVSSPVVVDNTIFISSSGANGSTNNGVFAFDKSNGNFKWKFPTTLYCSPTISVVSGGKIYNSSLVQ